VQLGGGICGASLRWGHMQRVQEQVVSPVTLPGTSMPDGLVRTGAASCRSCCWGPGAPGARLRRPRLRCSLRSCCPASTCAWRSPALAAARATVARGSRNRRPPGARAGLPMALHQATRRGCCRRRSCGARWACAGRRGPVSWMWRGGARQGEVQPSSWPSSGVCADAQAAALSRRCRPRWWRLKHTSRR
jgi:hypothetical protein